MGLFDVDRPSYAYNPKKGIRFSGDEIRALAIAIGVLTICFTVAFTSNGILDLIGRLNAKSLTPLRILLITFVSFFSVLTAFVFHELAHKIVANRYGLPAAFSYSKQGLMFAFFISFLTGFLFAAPGAVMIYGRPTKKQNGIISLAGPLTNLILGVIFGMLFILFGLLDLITGVGFLFAFIFFWIAAINTFIGAFNMIPIGNFDGAKILRWNKIVYFILVAFFIPGIIFFFFFNFIGG